MINRIIQQDLFRVTGEYDLKKLRLVKRKNNGFRYLYYWRKLKEKPSLLMKFYYQIRLHMEALKYGIEIPLYVDLGEGALLIHAYAITINSKTKIGKNVVIMKGATLGNIKSGIKAGSPTIGNNVYIGLNAVIVGNISIGDDVLISGNAFVNFDVPPHSVVVGNPGKIHRKEFAARDYILNPIDTY